MAGRVLDYVRDPDVDELRVHFLRNGRGAAVERLVRTGDLEHGRQENAQGEGKQHDAR